ncbi:hypothetical protein HDU76_000712 [Blyttiomyces sp. JEL0837]|nr:hypothetical protein HDU76_000712 [Blyttiomyces sp. JEL0837]
MMPRRRAPTLTADEDVELLLLFDDCGSDVGDVGDVVDDDMDDDVDDLVVECEDDGSDVDEDAILLCSASRLVEKFSKSKRFGKLHSHK